jgi:hypothetical protein
MTPAPQEWRPKSVLCATSLNLGEIEGVAFGYRLAQSVNSKAALLLRMGETPLSAQL